MKPVAWLGADPGMSGAIACIVNGGEKVYAYDTPRMEDGSLDHWTLAAHISSWVCLFDIKGVTIERVHSMPKQGVVSSFTFGDSFGALRQAFASAGLRYTLVPSGTWKVLFGLKGGRENKHLSRELATKLFPAHKEQWKLVKHDGRAEAVLLAHYGSKLQ